MKKLLLALFLTGLVIPSEAADRGQHVQLPADALVADEATAIRIAEAIFAPIYGERIVAKQRPLIANLVGEVWIVSGTLPPHAFGRRLHIEISKHDGRILQVTLGQRHDSAM